MSSSAPSSPTGPRLTNRWLLPTLIGLTLVAINIPYIFAWWSTPPGLRYAGALFTFEDTYSYFAKMQQGFDGAWTYENRFTTEPHAPAPLFMFYLFLGHAARVLGVTIPVMFHLSRNVFALMFVFGLWNQVRRMDLTPAAQMLGALLVLFGGGMGWIAIVLGGFRPSESYWMEAYGYFSLLLYPHFAASLALMLFAIQAFSEWMNNSNPRRWIVLLTICSWGLAWVHPRLLLTVILIAVGIALFSSTAESKSRRMVRCGVALLVLLAASVPTSAAVYLSVANDPIWRAWADTETRSPNALGYLLTYGVMWLLSLSAIGSMLRTQNPWSIAMAVWLILGIALPYLPFESQRRMIQGLIIPVGILSGIQLDNIARLISARLSLTARARWLLVFLAMVLLCGSLFSSLRTGMDPIRQRQFPWYYDQSRAAAMQWLEQNSSPDETVLCSQWSGVFLPWQSGNRVMLGHWAETLNIEEKRKSVERFFAINSTHAERTTVLEHYGVDLIFFSGSERRLGEFDPHLPDAPWVSVYDADGISIFRMRHSPLAQEPQADE